MNFSKPALHAPVLQTQAHKDLIAGKLSTIANERRRARALAPRAAAMVGDSISIPVESVSLNSNFDAYISIDFPGADARSPIPLVVDTGNSSLIIPDFSVIASLPHFCENYKVLQYNVQEPWFCPANVVKGPIIFPIDANTAYTIPDCVFYACTGPNAQGERTANFGAGCVTPWSAGSNEAIQAPFSYRADYRYVEFNYAPVVEKAGNGPDVATGSSLTLYRTMPAGYRMLDIVKSVPWMSVRPKSLTIGSTTTKWPGPLASKPIAMIDTGGGPVFLNDTNNLVWATDWPGTTAVPLPFWTPGSLCCQSISGDLAIALEDDAGGTFSYRIDAKQLPESVRGLTLVMCRKVNKLDEQGAINLGGLSVLFNHVLIDYAAAKVGFKAKSPGPA
jgi:hypothetical protein